MHRRFAANHEAMLALIHRFERRVADGSRSDPALLAKGRFEYARQFAGHNALVERCLRSLATDRLPRTALDEIAEHGDRVQTLRLQYSACVSQWPLDVAMADWNGYVTCTLKFHLLAKDHMAWEQDVIFPLIGHFLPPAAVTALLEPVDSGSTGPSSPAPRHTIGASSSASAPSDFRSGTPAAATEPRAAGGR
jgi:hypothetical protein